MGLAKHGITENTPKNILLGAGTIYKNLTWVTSTWTGTILGATSGGNKLSITSELVDIELDGALVKVKGLTVKQGEAGSMEVNLTEITPDILKTVLIAKDGTSAVTGYGLIETKADIETTDYLDNIAFVGFKTSGDPIIIIMENALCTSGLETDTKNKENAVIAAKFECYAEIAEGIEKLPIKIYYPTVS